MNNAVSDLNSGSQTISSNAEELSALSQSLNDVIEKFIL